MQVAETDNDNNSNSNNNNNNAEDAIKLESAIGTTATDNDTDNIERHPEFWRYHFERDDRFPWQAMNALGWKWHAGRNVYQAPPRPDGSPGREIGDSNKVLDYLNSFAIPDVYTNLKWADDDDDDNDDFTNAAACDENNDKNITRTREERKIGRALRKAVLEIILQRDGNTNRSNNNIIANDGMSSSMKEHDGDEDNTNVVVSTRRTTRQNTRKTERALSSSRTVTALEKGTDLYLRKRTQARGGSKKAKSSSDAAKKKSDASSSKKSAVTVAALDRLTLQQCRDFIESHPMDEIKKIEQSYHDQFSKWRFLLSTNHSLLFYGAGSKRELLNAFATEELRQEGRSLIIDGTDPDVTVEGILDLLVHICLEGLEPADLSAIPRPSDVPVTGKSSPWKAGAIVERAIMVGRGLAHYAQGLAKPFPTFLVIHSLDARRLATPLAQEALAALFVNSTVANGVASLRLAASVDHVDAPTFLWDPLTEANFSWFPCCVNTYRPFLEELCLIEEDQLQRKKIERESRTNTQAQRILDVLGNLAPRHTEVVQLLAQLQATNKNKNEWIDYLQYRERCKGACAINKDSQLRSLLTELKDHGLVVSKLERSKEWVQIPFPAEKLQEIIDFEREN